MILIPVMVAVLVFVAACAVGAAALALLDRRRTLGDEAFVLFSFGLGLGIIAHATLLMGLAGLARWTGWLLLGAGLLCVGAPMWRGGHGLARTGTDAPPCVGARLWRELKACFRAGADQAQSLTNLILIACLVLAGAVTFLSALTPPFQYDVLEYHIAGPLRWLKTGTVGLFPGNVYANMPCETEMLYTAAMSAARAMAPSMAWQAPSVIHWMFGAGALCVMAAILKRLSVKAPVRLLALLLTALHPVVSKIAYDAYVDLAVMFWVGLGLLAWLEWLAARDGTSTYNGRLPFFLCSVFFGLAVCAKLTAAVFYVVPAVALLVPVGCLSGDRAGRDTDKHGRARTRQRFFSGVGAGRAGRAFGAIGVAAGGMLAAAVIIAAVFAPWVARAWMATGDPFFPALAGWFHTPNWSAAQSRLWVAYHGQTFPWRTDYWMDLVKRLNQPGYWAALPCLFVVVSRRRDGRRAMALWAAAAYALWCLERQSADRFILPALMAAAPVSAAILSEEIGRRRWAGVALWGLVALTALPGALDNLATWRAVRPWSCLPNARAARLWQTQAVSPPESARAAFWANENLPANARLLLVFESRFGLFEHAAAGNTLFDRSALLDALAGQTISTAEDIRTALRRQGFTHVLINNNDLYLFIELFTKDAYTKAVKTGKAPRGAAERPAPEGRSAREGLPVPEDFHIPFMTDPRYPPVRRALLQFLGACRDNPLHVETRNGAPIVCIAQL